MAEKKNSLAQRGAGNALRSRSMSEDEVDFGGNPIDDFRRTVNTRRFTPKQARENRNALAWEMLSATPGPGNVIAANDAYTGAGEAYNALSAGRYRDAGINALLAGLSGAGAVLGLPVGRYAKGAADAGKDTLNIFAGPMAKTADHAALAKAQEMAQAGASRDEIWRDTGWMQGVDGKWKFEIDDSAAMMGLPPLYHGELPAGGPAWLRSGSLGETLDHPALYDAYPAMAKGDVQIHPGVEKSYYARKGDEPNAWDHYSFRPKAINNPSVPLHEAQHGVQQAEDFARGSSPEVMTEYISDLQDKAFYAGQRLRSQTLNPEKRAQLRQEYEEAMQELDRLGNATPGDLYNRLAGEVEARNVQSRMNMSAAERRANAPWNTQDVPDDQQIVRFR